MMQTEEIPKLFQRTLEWESLNQRVKTLEANKGVEGSWSGASPRVKEWLSVIEDNRRKIRDVIKDLTMEVKDVVANL